VAIIEKKYHQIVQLVMAVRSRKQLRHILLMPAFMRNLPVVNVIPQKHGIL
jgi:hypothetical protein